MSHADLERDGWHEVDAGIQKSFELAAQGDKGEQAGVVLEVYQHVDIAERGLLTACDTAKDPHVLRSRFRAEMLDLSPVSPYLPTQRACKSVQSRWGPTNSQFEFKPGGGHQFFQDWQGGLPRARFVSADHTLRHTCGARELCLAEPGTPAGLVQRFARSSRSDFGHDQYYSGS